MKNVKIRLKESKPQKKISPAAHLKYTRGFLRSLSVGARAAYTNFRCGFCGQFRLGERPAANGRCSTNFSIKRI